MGLERYREMRDFKKTREPRGRARAAAAPRFVIQEHHASHLHYDFRLEAEGVLKSWAIPKQPSMNPAVKRLAVEVEDHPVEYARFEGRIPEGEYGAGHVRIWDRGEYGAVKPAPGRHWLREAIDAGRIEFTLQGRRLRGRFLLVRTQMRGGKPNWLFMKRPEDGTPARTDPLAPLYLKVEGRVLKLSNLDKVLYPEADFTKRNVLNYYRKAAPALLPHLAGRAITLLRYPEGVAGESFYEKHAPAHRPAWIRTVRKKDVSYVRIDSLPALLWVANLAALEIHPFLSVAPRFQVPTSVVFDLDPGEGADVLRCAEVALLLRAHFARLGLESFVKSSGSKGLQLYVPLNTPVTFARTKAFAKDVAERMQARHPALVTALMSKLLRRGKVMIDWSQNDPHKTTVAVYSLRGRARPNASAPLRWEEVERALKKRDGAALFFTHDQVLRRLARDGDLFRPVLTLKQKLPKPRK